MSCPFFGRCVEVCGRGELRERCQAGFSAGSPEAQLEGYQDGDVLSSTIMYGMGNRSNGGGKVKTRTLHKPKHAAPCRTFVL